MNVGHTYARLQCFCALSEQVKDLGMVSRSQVVYDREVITTEPPKKGVKGVLFAFHGCLQSVTQFGFASPACPTCHGRSQHTLEQLMRCETCL